MCPIKDNNTAQMEAKISDAIQQLVYGTPGTTEAVLVTTRAYVKALKDAIERPEREIANMKNVLNSKIPIK